VHRSFRTADQAKRAIIELNGRFIGKKPIVVMLHIKKEQRRLQKHLLQVPFSSDRDQSYNLL
jgi:hypothetical protein